MDPVTAIGLVGNILTFIDFASKILKGAKSIHDSSFGTLEENQQREVIAREMQAFASQLLVTQTPELSGHEKGLCDLAAECRAISKRLIEILNKVKAKLPNSTRHSIISSVRNKWYEKDRQDLEQRLSNCRSQLELQLSFVMAQDIKVRLGSLVEASEKDIARLKRLQETLDGVSRGVAVASLSPQAQEQVRQLMCIPDETLTIIFQQRILKGLAFDGMHGRYEMVDAAHSKTFRWLFAAAERDLQSDAESRSTDSGHETDSASESSSIPSTDHDPRARVTQETSARSSGDTEVRSTVQRSNAKDVKEDEVKRAASRKLKEWLSSGDGIFHISGKLGSGKSTLMKFLCDHSDTKAELQRWAGGRTLILANYFFWKPGTALQKSLAGLQRALLHDVLHACPDLIHQLLPETWKEVSTSPWQAQWTVTISERNIRLAFTQLITETSWRSHYCFCFFIDGLDEFEETALFDHGSLTEFLCSWTEAAPGDVKLCVSSREHNVFMNAFRTDQRIRIHELTDEDMKSFCQDKLGRLAEDNEKAHLIEAVVIKARGIFLWVALVIRSMREQLENGATIAALKLELDLLPDELDGLFEHIVKSLGKSTRRKVYRTLRILGIAKHYRLVVSMFAYSFLEDYDLDPDFVRADGFSHMTESAILEREALAATRLNGCKGLLEPDPQHCLDYVHRSVAEFLQGSWIKDAMDHSLRDFNGPDAVSQLLLAELQSRSVPLDDQVGFPKYYYNVFSSSACLLRMRAENGLDTPPYTFLSRLEAAQLPFPWERFKGGPESHKVEVPCANGSNYMMFIMTPTTGCKESPDERGALRFLIPCYVSMMSGYHEYAAWKILNDATTTDNDTKVVLLAFCSIAFNPGISHRSSISVLENLLEGGFLSLHTEAPIWPSNWPRHFVSKDNCLSFWQLCLVEIYLVYHVSEDRMDGVEFDTGLDHFGQVLELCLRYKPDLHFAFTIDPSIETSKRSQQHAVITAGRDRKRIELVFEDSTMNACAYPTLRSWIEHSPLKNKARLLQMYDSQMMEEEQETSPATAPDLHTDGERIEEENDQKPAERSMHEPSHVGNPTDLSWGTTASARSVVEDEPTQRPLSTGSPSLNALPLYDRLGVSVVFAILGALMSILIPMVWVLIGINDSSIIGEHSS